MKFVDLAHCDKDKYPLDLCLAQDGCPAQRGITNAVRDNGFSFVTAEDYVSFDGVDDVINGGDQLKIVKVETFSISIDVELVNLAKYP